MIWPVPTPNIMGKNGFLLLVVVVVFQTFRATFSADSQNITTDQLALLQLKSHIHDPRNLLESWSTSTSVCNWIGVTCGSINHRVTALNLSGMGLTGTIQPHLGNLSFLAYLNIVKNSFHGPIPIELANLRNLGWNFFTLVTIASVGKFHHGLVLSMNFNGCFCTVTTSLVLSHPLLGIYQN
ncbi:hypothetical protein PTKIN_Ptkin14bG0120900 [Pterospermum kingtungense]